MTKSRISKAPRFPLARGVLFLVGAASAAFGVAGWTVPELPMQGDLPWAALVLAGLTGLSALVVPATCEIVGRSIWSVLLIPPALVFGGINAYSFHHAVDALIEQPRRDEHHNKIVAPLETKLAVADAAVAAHTAPVFPDTMGPKNIAARMAAWTAAHQPLIEAADSAAKALNEAPVYVAFAPDLLVWSVAAAIDISLAFGLAGIGLVSGSIQKKIDASRPKRKQRAKKKVAPAKGFTPRVVVSNT